MAKKTDDLQARIDDLTLDLQRTRADFENFRKRVEVDKAMAKAGGRVSAIAQLLPVIDTIERAIAHAPKELEANSWVSGIVGVSKKLEKSMNDLGVTRIDASAGTLFNPELHEAVQFDESEGEHEVIAEELQAGYKLGDDILRHSMVKVTRQ
ncbi:MAG: nucleotide exchange factor GrpE [Candidatus Saccharimonas sp.]